MRWTLGEIARALGSAPRDGDEGVVVGAVVTDSRAIAPGALFVPLVGERFDGHDFAARAFEAGAVATLWRRGRAPLPAGPRIDVDDTLGALGALARAWRERHDVVVVGVTGSNGKTTTKEMLARILERHHGTDAVLATGGNFNNEIGVPLTLFRLEARHRAAVVEMGMNHPGEIARLAGMARPQAAVITNVGPAHMMSFDSVEAVARAKCELLDGLVPGGRAAVNGDDAILLAEARRHGRDLVRFGFSADCEVRAEGLATTAEGVRGTLVCAGARAPFALGVHGRHNAMNALAAAAGAMLAGATVETAAAALGDFAPVEGRSVVRDVAGVHVIDDTYNANPASMARALEMLAELGAGARTWAALGEMRELGEASARMHAEVGERAARAGVAGLVALGECADEYARGARAAGLTDVVVARSHTEVVEALRERLGPGDWLLVKGSRGARMEQVTKGLEACSTT